MCAWFFLHLALLNRIDMYTIDIEIYAISGCTHTES